MNESASSRVKRAPQRAIERGVSRRRLRLDRAGGGAVSCAKAGGPAIVHTVSTMTEIARAVHRIFSRSEFEIIALIMRAIPYLKKTLLAFEP